MEGEPPPQTIGLAAHVLTSAAASSRACAWLGRTAASPNFTSTTRAESPSTAFLLRMEAGEGAQGWGQARAPGLQGMY